MELLESANARPRQARYQAALRPDMKYAKIIRDFPTELLLPLKNSITIALPDSNGIADGHRHRICIETRTPRNRASRQV